MIYFCSDMHIAHDNVLKFDPFRNFSSIREHDDFLLKELQSLSSKDTVYFLGDLIWRMDAETEAYVVQEL
jgi:calcineurin-like phosphoesterase family protein